MVIKYHVPGIPGTFNSLPECIRVAGLDNTGKIQCYYEREIPDGSKVHKYVTSAKPSGRAIARAMKKV
jgi:hypothetical protein